MYTSVASFFLLIFPFKLLAQQGLADSITKKKDPEIKASSFILPAAMITYGIIGLESHTLKGINEDTQGEMKEHIDRRFSVDDFSQYSPLLAVYALNLAGLKGRNNLGDRSIIAGTAYLIMGTTVNLIKQTGNVTRPDGSSTHSFPSGHTATAFVGAEILHQEYKDVSPLLGISGYLVAAGTGYFRMYNNRHWLTDVVAGAGIGILSAKVAYKLHPFLKRTIFKRERNFQGMIVPKIGGGNYGVGVFLMPMRKHSVVCNL